jgi:hypothetical protein
MKFLDITTNIFFNKYLFLDTFSEQISIFQKGKGKTEGALSILQQPFLKRVIPAEKFFRKKYINNFLEIDTP